MLARLLPQLRSRPGAAASALALAAVLCRNRSVVLASAPAVASASTSAPASGRHSQIGVGGVHDFGGTLTGDAVDLHTQPYHHWELQVIHTIIHHSATPASFIP